MFHATCDICHTLSEACKRFRLVGFGHCFLCAECAE